ncbi:hypothetical protein [Bacillus haynesii]|uniref:hypothetical protein n=1 Tax=Bacillus haynesii TaxID=1925021 RepID=UPI00227F8602|nr:hypothetical protein [Bacillus haynesii]MCY8641261.1 hypothetical protein [Bacillus haynesii]
MAEQSRYYISDRNNEYFKILNTLEHALQKAKDNNNIVLGESIEKLLNELKENLGQNLAPWHFIWIMQILLDYVPDEVKGN